MEINFSALVARIGSEVAGVRGCIVVSKDGLVLGSHPADGEAILRPAWLRFAALGEVTRGFIEFPGEIWVFVQRGSYGAFAICADTTRPGLMLDEMEQSLVDAEDERVRGEAPPTPSGGEAPRSKPRAPLHPESRPAPVQAAPVQAAPVQAAPVQAAPVQSVDPSEPAPAYPAGPDPDVDRVMLAQEFAQLLGESGYDDEEE